MSSHPTIGTAKPYSPLLILFAIFSCLLDPLWGVLAKITSIFWHPRPPARADTPRRRRRGLVLVLGGIEGPSQYNYDMVRALLRSRYRGSVVRVDWNAGIPFLRSLVNLISRRHKQRQSVNLARLIVEHQRAYPDSPVGLIAQSGGCYIVVRALEQLPDAVQVQTAILLAPSISPGYDITVAADRCKDGLISVGGPGDFFFLGLGTLLFGTSDRVFSPSAGWVGWHHRPPGFVEARWHPSWVRFGYYGNHTSSSSPRFIANVLARNFAVRGESTTPA